VGRIDVIAIVSLYPFPFDAPAPAPGAADYFRRFNLLLSPRVADFAVRREQRPDRKVG